MTQEKPISLKHLLLRLADAPIMADQTLVRRRVSRLAGMDVGRIRTWTRPAELTRLYKLASRLPEGATVLEVGSYLGASTCYLAAALKRINGTLFCVDTWENQTMPEGEQDTMQRFRDHTRAFTDTIRTIRKRSEHLTISDVTMPVAMVFLDGDHSFESDPIRLQSSRAVGRRGGDCRVP